MASGITFPQRITWVLALIFYCIYNDFMKKLIVVLIVIFVYLLLMDQKIIFAQSFQDITKSSTILTVSNPTKAVVNSKTNKIYVVNYSAGTISVVDSLDDSVLSTIKVDNKPTSLVVNEKTSKIYVSYKDSNIVSIIDGLSNKVEGSFLVNNGDIVKDIDIDNNKLYFINRISSSILVVDADNKEVDSKITFPKNLNLQNLVFIPNTKKLYVVSSKQKSTNKYEGLILVIDSKNNKVMGKINLRSNYLYGQLFVDYEKNQIYLLYTVDPNILPSTQIISIIDGFKDKEIGKLNLNSIVYGDLHAEELTDVATFGYHDLIWDIAINPIENKIYLSTSHDRIIVIDRSTRKGISIISLSDSKNYSFTTSTLLNFLLADPKADPDDAFKLGDEGVVNHILVNPNTNKVYAIASVDDSLKVIDSNKDTLLSTIVLGTGRLGDIAYDSSKNKIYLSNDTSDRVTVVDALTDKVDSLIQISDLVSETSPTLDENNGPNFRKNIAINSNTNKLYLGSVISHNVYVIDVLKNELLKTIQLETYPNGITVNPNTNKIYVLNYEGNKVSVIDGSTDELQNAINVNNGSCNIAINLKTNELYVIHRNNSNQLSIIDNLTEKLIKTIDLDEPDLNCFVTIDEKLNKAYLSSPLQPYFFVVNSSTSALEDKLDLKAPFFQQLGFSNDKDNNKLYIFNHQGFGSSQTINEIYLFNTFTKKFENVIFQFLPLEGFGSLSLFESKQFSNIEINPFLNKLYTLRPNSLIQTDVAPQTEFTYITQTKNAINDLLVATDRLKTDPKVMHLVGNKIASATVNIKKSLSEQENVCNESLNKNVIVIFDLLKSLSEFCGKPNSDSSIKKSDCFPKEVRNRFSKYYHDFHSLLDIISHGSLFDLDNNQISDICETKDNNNSFLTNL